MLTCIYLYLYSALKALINVLTIKSMGLSLHSGSALKGVREVLSTEAQRQSQDFCCFVIVVVLLFNSQPLIVFISLFY